MKNKITMSSSSNEIFGKSNYVNGLALCYNLWIERCLQKITIFSLYFIEKLIGN